MRAALLCVAALLGAGAQPSHLISSGSPASRVVALTFDAGADRGNALSILKTLEAHHIRGSFGMTGLWAQVNPDLVKRMAHDGDLIMNHTYDHRSFTGLSTRTVPLSTAERSAELTRTDTIVWRLTHHSTRPWWRPPFGDYDQAALLLAWRLGYNFTAMWTLDSLGWERISTVAILSRCEADLRPGAILLMHVGSQSHDADALDPLIRFLARRGYHFETLAALASAR